MNSKAKNKNQRSRRLPPVNEYYIIIGRRVRNLRYLCILALVGFLIFSIATHYTEITFDNISYLMRYIDIQNGRVSAKTEFPIDADQEAKSGFYKNNIVILKKNKIDIYDNDGRRNFTKSMTLSKPVLEISDKYICAYDIGSSQLYFFNSFSKVWENKESRPIFSVSMNNRGDSVVVTKEDGYKSAVHVMNSSFRDIYRCYFYEDFVMNADISEDAKKIVTANFTAREGEYLCKLYIYETEREDYISKTEIKGEMPVDTAFFGEGVALLTDCSLKTYDGGGAAVSDFGFMYKTLLCYKFSQSHITVVLGEKSLKSSSRIIVFDTAGNIVSDTYTDSEILDLEYSDDQTELFYLTKTGLYKLGIDGRDATELDADYDDTTSQIIYADASRIYLSGLIKVNMIKNPAAGANEPESGVLTEASAPNVSGG